MLLNPRIDGIMSSQLSIILIRDVRQTYSVANQCNLLLYKNIYQPFEFDMFLHLQSSIQSQVVKKKESKFEEKIHILSFVWLKSLNSAPHSKIQLILVPFSLSNIQQYVRVPPYPT